MAKTSVLTASELAALPCPYCGRQLPEQTNWLAEGTALWGVCGIQVRRNDELAGVIAFAPTERADQAMLKMLWVRPEAVDYGLGRQLVQATAAELVRRRIKVLLASGGRPGASCATPPSDFLTEVGFSRRAEDRLYRLDLRQAVLGRTHLGLLGRLVHGLGLGPQPAGGVVSGRANRN